MRSARTSFVIFLATILAAGCASARSQEAPGDNGKPDGHKLKKYSEVVTDKAVSDSGLFVLHTVEEKLYYEIPLSMLDREMLLVSRRAATAQDLGYGGMKNNTQTVRWQKSHDKVLLRIVSYENVAADSLPIYEAVRSSNFEPIVGAFAIEAWNADSSAVVIETTALFTEDVPFLGLPAYSRDNYKVSSLDKDRSYLEWTKSFPENIEVRHVLTYKAKEPPSNSSTGTISVEMNQSMVLLPEVPMQPRLYDERVGFFSVQQTDYGLSDHKTVDRTYITRYRLEPADTAAFLRGELVDPVEPIVYWIDPATPEKWRPYLKAGVEDWQPAFEHAGFRNAIIAKDPPTPEEDPEFSPEDIRYSVIRWFPSDIQNAFGPHVHDPRSGEILESDIGWYHNVANLLRNWYLIQTAAANPEARAVKFSDEVMGKLIRFVAAHEVGHTIGLPHNMKASSAYPVDSLRAPGFVCRMGVAPSIMDYARFNYVAQPGDEGACFDPRVGPYDDYSIMWGYRPIIEADSPDAEMATLNQWIRDVEDDPTFWFGDPSAVDPTSLTEAIGSDAMEAGELGIANLKRILPSLMDWTFEEGEDWSELEELYNQVTGQWNRYMGHVVANIGGVVRTRRRQGQSGVIYQPVPEETQRRAMQFITDEAFAPPTWMIDEEILGRIENVGTVERMRRLQVGVLNNVLQAGRMQRLIEAEARFGDGTYSLTEMMTDVRSGVWTELRAGGSIDTYRRNLQRGHLERLDELMNGEGPSGPTSSFPGLDEYFTNVNLPQSDIRAVVRGELETLQREIRNRLGAGTSRMTRLHLQDALARIEAILDPEE
ncbi:MAG: zinc-dependent metalloprotease [marine benthic group bacterium]|nr:zinc-dependent metalloprotease [Gemmatimonadota bacterium]